MRGGEEAGRMTSHIIWENVVPRFTLTRTWPNIHGLHPHKSVSRISGSIPSLWLRGGMARRISLALQSTAMCSARTALSALTTTALKSKCFDAFSLVLVTNLVRQQRQVKGWIDVTYLSERLRIARGNKGTLFVLQRAPQSRPSPSAETMR